MESNATPYLFKLHPSIPRGKIEIEPQANEVSTVFDKPYNRRNAGKKNEGIVS